MKKFLGLIAALAVTFVVIGIGQFISQMIFPNPNEVDFNNLIPSLKAAAKGMSAGALLFAVLIHLIGSLAGGLALGRILRADNMNVGMTLGGILTAIGMVNMVGLGHPEWFYLDLLAYMPPAMFGANYTSKL